MMDEALINTFQTVGENTEHTNNTSKLNKTSLEQCRTKTVFFLKINHTLLCSNSQNFVKNEGNNKQFIFKSTISIDVLSSYSLNLYQLLMYVVPKTFL